MKKHLIIYAILVIIFIAFNTFVKLEDARLNTAINILFGSIIFGYIAFLAFILLKKLGKKK